MRLTNIFAGATLVFAFTVCSPNLRAGAQDTILKTEPLTVQEVNQRPVPSESNPAGSIPNIHVNVNLNNENLRDAIKKIIGKADVTYEIDSDVPTDKKISLKVENCPLTLALNLLVQSTGIGCTQSVKKDVSNTNGKSTVTAQVHLHFRKAQSIPLGQEMPWWQVNIPVNAFDPNKWGDTTLKVPNVILTNPVDGKNTLRSLLVAPNGTTDYAGKVLNNFNLYSSDSNGNKPFLYNFTTSEERSTFTCPHCHEQVTIIKKHVAPKCPTCGRTFRDDWKFCPVDGTKRPEDTGAWKFCPHCGKPVS